MLRKLPRSLVALSLIGVVALSACSDDDDDGNGPSRQPPAAVVISGQASGDTITITWALADDATSYRAELRATGESDRTQDLGADDTEAVFTGLTDGTSYTAQVFSINSVGETGSNELTLAVNFSVVTVTGAITTDQTWLNERAYVLSGPVFVGVDVGADGNAPGGVPVTLTIEPGTTVLGDIDPPTGTRGSYLVVTRGSKLIADANRSLADKWQRPDPDSVIVFTSSAPRGSRQRADWGGLVINGRAPTNAGDEAIGEGGSGLYGGPVEDDNSGILRGVRVEYAGDRVTATDELNGIAFQGTGAGTTVDYVQVHYNEDDGTEPFGGTVTQTHMVVTGIGDDSFDGTDGYGGFMQFVIAQQRADNADNGFEISNNGDNPSATPKSMAVIANATMVGSGFGTGEIAGLGTSGDVGALFREGSHYRVFNSIITGFGDSGFDVEGSQTAANADCRIEIGCTAGEAADPENTLRFESSILWDNVSSSAATPDDNFTDASGDGYTAVENKTFFETAGFNNLVADPNLPAEAFNIGTMMSPPNVIPTAMPGGYTAFDPATLNNATGLVMPTDGRTLQTTNYAGAVAPGTALNQAWYYGWTVWATDGSDSRPNQDGN